MRVDPPVSEPMPAGANRAATPAALPPLLPPGILDGSYGLRTGPEISGSHCRQGLRGRQLQHLAPCRRGSLGVREDPAGTAQPTRCTRSRKKLQEPPPAVTHGLSPFH